MRFEWDPEKARRNLAKHGLSFNEAATVFGDSFGWTYPDREHSEFEERWITVGMSEQHLLLVVAHTIEENGQRVRILSAR
ncbi:MAG: BrnT family toxin, partial [Acidobacteriota bacterium]